jgi:excisionase family DNA binding protein
VSSLGILTLAEVASVMKVSQKTVTRWIAAKKLRAAKIGHKTYRILESDLMRFINNHIK